MATPIAGAIVLYGFNDAVRSTITIIAVAIASVILAYVISAIINKFNLMNVGSSYHVENQVKESV